MKMKREKKECVGEVREANIKEVNDGKGKENK